MWPDPLTATYCIPVPVTYYRWTSNPTISICSCSAIGILTCFIFISYFQANKTGFLNKHIINITIWRTIAYNVNNMFIFYKITVRIIKATSVNLSIISLIGLTITYASVILLIAPPKMFSCVAGYFLMNIGISLTFGCLLLVSRYVIM